MKNLKMEIFMVILVIVGFVIYVTISAPEIKEAYISNSNDIIE